MPTPSMEISTATVGDMTNTVEAITIPTATTEGAGSQDETRWQNTRWSEFYGIYTAIPDVKIAIDSRATWTVGKGWKAKDARTEVILENIKGQGKDTFTSIMKNMITVRRIGGDAFAEIMWDDSESYPINLKPLDPSSMVLVVNSRGILRRYEQVQKVGKKTRIIKFEPKDIFHLANKRIADNIGGTSDIEVLKEIVTANNEAFEIQRKVIRHFAKPRFFFGLNTDNQAKITAFKSIADTAMNKGENVYMAQNVVKPELIAVPENSTINIKTWRSDLRNSFYQTVGTPQIILGNAADFGESSAKVAYASYMQSVKEEQRDIIEQIWNQLYLHVDLEYPFDFRNELISDEKKDGAQGMEVQPQDSAITQGGVM